MGDFHENNRISLVDRSTLCFDSREFRVIRVLLRLLSLWRPQSAGFLESYVYPVFVNLLLFTTGPIRNSLRATEESTWLSIQVFYIVHEIAVWLGHILGNSYFASRDLETNALKPVRPLDKIKKPLNRRLKIINVAAVVSMTFFSIMLCTLFVVTRLMWHTGAERFSAQLPHVHGTIDHILFVVVIFSIVYDLGVGLALIWTLALLYSCYAARLKILESIFLKWKHSSVDAVSLFGQVYARPIQRSWKRIAWWFLAHNIVALAIPLYGYQLAQAFDNDIHHSKHLPQFICYLVFIVTIWLGPIIMGEQIKRRERTFMERMNNICPWLLEEENCELDSGCTDGGARLDRNLDSGETEGDSVFVTVTKNIIIPNAPPQTLSNGSSPTDGSDSTPKYTFVSRGKELKNFLHFLEERRLGVVARGYSIQLNLSFISLIGAAISFLFEIQSRNSQNVMHQHCNCTIS